MNPAFEWGIALSMPSSIPPGIAPSHPGGDENDIALSDTDSDGEGAAWSAPGTTGEMTEHFPPTELGIALSRPTLKWGRRLGFCTGTHEAVPSMATASWKVSCSFQTCPPVMNGPSPDVRAPAFWTAAASRTRRRFSPGRLLVLERLSPSESAVAAALPPSHGFGTAGCRRSPKPRGMADGSWRAACPKTCNPKGHGDLSRLASLLLSRRYGKGSRLRRAAPSDPTRLGAPSGY